MKRKKNMTSHKKKERKKILKKTLTNIQIGSSNRVRKADKMNKRENLGFNKKKKTTFVNN